MDLLLLYFQAVFFVHFLLLILLQVSSYWPCKSCPVEPILQKHVQRQADHEIWWHQSSKGECRVWKGTCMANFWCNAFQTQTQMHRTAYTSVERSRSGEWKMYLIIGLFCLSIYKKSLNNVYVATSIFVALWPNMPSEVNSEAWTFHVNLVDYGLLGYTLCIEHVESKKCKSHSENMWKVCLFCSQNNKIVWLSNMADTFLEKFMRCAKDCGLFFLIVLFERWLAEQANSGQMDNDMVPFWCYYWYFLYFPRLACRLYWMI